MKGSLKKGKWSKEEDNLIKNHIEKYGVGRSWQGLSNTLGLQRCGRSCRSRWLNYLRPGLKHGNFSPAEDRFIYEMYSKKGSCWSVIAAKLPGRTDLAIKNYWNSTLKKRFHRAARSRRLRHRRTGSTSSEDSASLDLALVDEESISPTELVVYDEESISPTAPVVYKEEDSAGTARDLQLVVYNEASATAGSPSSHADTVLAAQAQPPAPPPTPLATVKEEPIAAAPISGPVRMEPRTPPPPADETSEEMDVDCGPMSPVPLGLMEPNLPRITMGLPHIAGIDGIDIFLWQFDYFDHHGFFPG